MEPADDLPDIQGDYTLTALIGRGPFCVVWRAARADGSEAALKILRARYCSDPHRVQRFEEEATLARSLRHPHIVSVEEVVAAAHSPQPYFAMPYLPGGHLGQFRRAAPEQ